MVTGYWQCSFDCALGKIRVIGKNRELVRLCLPEGKMQFAGEAQTLVNFPEPFTDFTRRFKVYLDGQNVVFDYPLNTAVGTDFQRAVWAAARRIPFGRTQSYRWLARQIGRPDACRAVGNALGKNPLPVLIPCHRVLAGDGSLGGFSAGLSTKTYLLGIEGVRVKDAV